MRQVGSKAEAEESMKAEFEKLVNEPWKVWLNLHVLILRMILLIVYMKCWQ